MACMFVFYESASFFWIQPPDTAPQNRDKGMERTTMVTSMQHS